MGSNYRSPPAKRAILYTTAGMPDPNPYISNGSTKRSKQPPPPLSVPPGHVAFRLLCHASRIGGVIGKSGNVIKQLQQSTGARIRVEDAPPESPDRVITVVAPNNVTGKVDISGLGSISNGEIDGDKEIDVSKAQEALVRVFERILEVAMESNGGGGGGGGGGGVGVGIGVVSCRLLAETSQVGSVIGKGGKVVEKIRKESGSKIRVLTDKLPACAGPADEMVEIEGDVLAVKKALVAVSRRLQDCPAVDKTRMVGSRPLEAVPQETLRRPLEAVPQETLSRPLDIVPQETLRRPLDVVPQATLRRPLDVVPQATLRRPLEAVLQETLPDLRADFLSQRNSVLSTMPSSSVSYASGVHPLSLESDRVPTLDTKTFQQEVMFRILCSNDRVGGVIGKGGTIVKNLQNETGASISIGATIAECDERLITVTASENPESRYSAAQKAVVLVFSKSLDGIEKGLDSGSSKGPSITARLLVPSSVVGCLLGKGGAIISEMRKVTGTNIRIIGGDQVPKCASDNDQVVQISGEFSNVKDAVYHVTGRLRDNLFSTALNSVGTRNSSSVLTETSPYGRLRDPASLGLQSSVGVSHHHSQHTNLTQSMDHLGLSHSLDRQPSPPRLWSSQMVAGVNSRGITDIGRGLISFKGGLELGSGSKSAIVTNTTVEIVVPENVIGSVYGDNGSNLSRLRQISGAKVIVHEPRHGSSDRIVVISGTPDETQAAQSLLQAFILTGPS